MGTSVFHLKLLSVQHNGEFDFLDDFVADMDFDTTFRRYLEELSVAIDQNG